MKSVRCACGAVIRSRHVPDYYRLTPNHREIRATHRWGGQPSQLKRFMDAAEAATRHGQTVLHFSAPPPDVGRTYDILKRCRRIGYLEYVCPRCERTLDSQVKRRRKTI